VGFKFPLKTLKTHLKRKTLDRQRVLSVLSVLSPFPPKKHTPSIHNQPHSFPQLPIQLFLLSPNFSISPLKTLKTLKKY